MTQEERMAQLEQEIADLKKDREKESNLDPIIEIAENYLKTISVPSEIKVGACAPCMKDSYSRGGF